MKPILFNTVMVREILDGRKTCTRRVIKPQPTALDLSFAENRADVDQKKVSDYKAKISQNVTNKLISDTRPPYHPGDILWVRETWGKPTCGTPYLYRAFTGPGNEPEKEDEAMRALGLKWRPSIHMPREAARIFLRVTDVRAERLQSITNSEVIKEGVAPCWNGSCKCSAYSDGCQSEPCANRDAYERECHTLPFARLWDSTIKKDDIGKYGWVANPWVWIIEFERIIKDEDYPSVKEGADHEI